MKSILGLVVLAVLGFAVAGCGGTKKAVVRREPNSLASRIPVTYAGPLPGLRVDHRIGPVSFREPEPQITRTLGRGVVVRIHGHPWTFYPRAGVYVIYPPAPKGEQTYAAFIMARSAQYKTNSGVGVGSTLHQLRQHIKVQCYGGKPVPGECQHERANINLPFTVFNIGPTKRIIEVAVVSGGD